MPQPTHCKPELLPISKSQVYQDTTAHSLQTGFTPYHTNSLFQFTRTLQPTHVNPQIKPVSSTSPRTAWSQNAQHNFGQKLPIWLTTHAMHTCMPMPYIAVLFSYSLMYPTLPFYAHFIHVAPKYSL